MTWIPAHCNWRCVLPLEVSASLVVKFLRKRVKKSQSDVFRRVALIRCTCWKIFVSVRGKRFSAIFILKPCKLKSLWTFSSCFVSHKKYPNPFKGIQCYKEKLIVIRSLHSLSILSCHTHLHSFIEYQHVTTSLCMVSQIAKPVHYTHNGYFMSDMKYIWWHLVIKHSIFDVSRVVTLCCKIDWREICYVIQHVIRIPVKTDFTYGETNVIESFKGTGHLR